MMRCTFGMVALRRAGSAICLAAALAGAALPVAAEARGWDRGGHWGRGRHDDIDAGDIFAGLLIIGGIAAIASAANKATPRQAERPAPDYRDPTPRYGERDDRPSWQEGRSVGAVPRGIGDAVDACIAEVERGTRRVDSVDGVRRDQRGGQSGGQSGGANGWHVEGRVQSGQAFACDVDAQGSVRRVTINGAQL